jgi:hypothetical protein
MPQADCSVGATPAEVEAALNRCVLAGQLQPLVHDTVEGLLEALSEDGMQVGAQGLGAGSRRLDVTWVGDHDALGCLWK